MKKAIAATFTVLLLASAGFTAAGSASAQGAFNLMVYPAKLELAATPGTTQEFAINVRNLGDQAETMRVYFNDYFIKANNEFVFARPGHYSYSCANWLSTDSPTMVVPPGQVVGKIFSLTVPQKAEPGGHYGVIFFEQAPPEGNAPVKARPRIGSLMLVTVPGQIVRQGEIKSVSVTSTWFWPTRKFPFLPKRKVTARIVFYNSGNVHLTVKGELSYKPSFGWGSGKVEFSEITVLPKTTRYLQADIPDPPLVGSFQIKGAVQYGPSLDVFDTTKEATASFSMYPISLLLLIMVLLAVIVAIWILRRWRKRKATVDEEGEKSAEEKSKKQEKDESAEEPPAEEVADSDDDETADVEAIEKARLSGAYGFDIEAEESAEAADKKEGADEGASGKRLRRLRERRK